MKNVTKISLLVLLSLAGLQVGAMNKEVDVESCALSDLNKCDGIEITSKNLYTYAPRVSLDLEKKLKSWTDENKDAWTAFVKQPGKVDEYKNKGMRVTQMLQKQNLTSLSSNTIIFELPTASGWLVKISGIMNRLCLQVAAQDKPYGQVKQIDQTKTVPTYQTVSRVLGAMKLHDAKKHHELDELGVVKKYVWSPTGRCDDESCIVVEQKLKGYRLLKNFSSQELDEFLTEKRVGQLLLAAKHAGLWNLTGDNIAVTKTNKLVILDTEQPNTMKPSQVFNGGDQAKSRFLFNVNCGVQSLYQALPKGSKARDRVEKWARQDKEVMGANNVKDLIKLFEDNK